MTTKKNQTKKNTKKMQHDVVYGVHSIVELLKAKRRKLVSIYTTKPLPKVWHRIENLLPKPRPNIQYVPRHVLDRMSCSSEHMGIVALVSPFKFQTKIFDPKKKPFILLLDSIQDIRNLGAILRSAYCTGVNGVVLCKKESAPLNAAAHKASAGLCEHLNIYVANSTHGAVLDLKKAGYNFYMAVLENGVDATKIDYKKPLCLVIGNEAVGISKPVQKEGTLITIPQRSADISYNASVATGILLFIISQNSK
ncbi:23S rRNA (guanosine(2251)-2'-O)-methyltransferase RlmB [Candidatus Dependentiae bacterium]